MSCAYLEFKIAWCSHRKVSCHCNSTSTTSACCGADDLLRCAYKWFPAQLSYEEWSWSSLSATGLGGPRRRWLGCAGAELFVSLFPHSCFIFNHQDCIITDNRILNLSDRFPQWSLFSKIWGDHSSCQSKCTESGCSMWPCSRVLWGWSPLCILPWEGRPTEAASLELCLCYGKVTVGKLLLHFVLWKDMFSVTALPRIPVIHESESSAKWDSEV